MTRANFGRDKDLFAALVKYLVELKVEGRLLPWEIPYFVRDFYNQLYEIGERGYYADKDGEYKVKIFDEYTKPLSMVSKTVKDGLLESDSFRIRAWEYRVYKIQEQQGMSFMEWLELPPHLLENLLTDIRREVQEVNAIKEKAKQQEDETAYDGPIDPAIAAANALRRGSKFFK